MTSAYHGGTSPGSPIHIPQHDQSDDSEIRITEGELKADIATIKTGTLTISLPGVAMWRKALPILENLSPATVLIAFDADWRSNTHVAKALVACAATINKAGFDLVVETWEPSHGKGLDDLLANGEQPERRGIAAAYAAKMRGATQQKRHSLRDWVKPGAPARGLLCRE